MVTRDLLRITRILLGYYSTRIPLGDYYYDITIPVLLYCFIFEEKSVKIGEKR